MAHPQQLHFVSLVRRYFFHKTPPKSVLEIGAYDLNGSVRACLSAERHLGVDLIPGPGVDLVKSGHDLDFGNEEFDCVISCECFEHNPYWKETFLNMYRMVSTDGVVIITCASRGRLEHGTERTSDKSPGTQSLGWQYYKNLTKKDFLTSFDIAGMFSRWGFFYIPVSQDLYFFGFKSLPAFQSKNGVVDFSLFSSEVDQIRKMTNSSGPVMHFLRSVEQKCLMAFAIFGDGVFQRFAIPYYKFRASVYKAFRRLFK